MTKDFKITDFNFSDKVRKCVICKKIVRQNERIDTVSFGTQAITYCKSCYYKKIWD